MSIQSIDSSSRIRSTNWSENDSYTYQHFLDMETLCDQLILLDYETYVVNSLKMRPINR